MAKKSVADAIVDTIQAAGVTRVSDPALLEGILREALANDGPVEVNALVNREKLSRPPHIEVAHAKSLSLYALKALMNGRGRELVELAKTNLLR